ncbi:1,6-dihydroxycyclohexa-2,4-diene-1-carboxylate dehydrogenase [Pseudarthrobacter sp. MM222]|uniref:1,6-dihydroxycyclohexa-2,4-diene-1-carboxylate dehydrogenase n=1 Tax=Pseudarthrobacter sp. MM222 TaxID=3018929 RepID=UPI00221EBDB5|nr:1,6-dihydroxycyclohexa-2,4-diene-1-carboxylate dehydrogenase [Pseudarthrobacter sp. MM222]CAI3805321.1 3-beta-hydroxycholanate 3-dehydrogenase (NADP(+)) [Pseudarthrobacter sp. MM222]
MRFTDKVVVVTGAAQGIGAVVAQKIAAEGGTVVLADRSELVREVCAELTAGGVQARYFLCDLETHAGASGLMAYAVAEFGRIDILINNVGGTIWVKPFEHYQVEEIEAEVRRSLFPTLWCCHAVLPYMAERQAGVIVNVSSIATRSINRVPYAASKGGVNALTASLAFEAASKGIRVVATAPGGTEAPPRKVARNPNAQSAQEKVWYQQIVDQTTESTLLKRYGTLEEQAAPILFMASDDASYITGVVLPVGGGDQG